MNEKKGNQGTHSFGFKTATSPVGKAYEPSAAAISMDLGIPVGGFTLLMS